MKPVIRWMVFTALVAGTVGIAWAQPVTTGPVSRPALPAVSPEKAKAAEADYEAGRKLFFQGEYKAAVETLEKAVAGDPTKGVYRLLLAKAYRYAGRGADAAARLAEILRENPEHVEAGVELSEILLADKKWDRVIATLEPLLKFKHDYPLYHMLAEAYYQKEDLKKAREYFEEAVRLNTRSGPDHYQLGNIYLAQSQFAKAATAYEKAGELGIDTAVLHFKLASVYFNLRAYLRQVTTAEVIGGEAGQIKNNLFLIDPVPGRKDVFYVAGPRSAIFQAARAVELGVTVPELLFLKANTWLKAGYFTKADALYKSLEGKLGKTDEGLFWFYRAETALGLNDFDGYLARLNKAIEAQPDAYKPMLADAYVTVANRYQQRGDSERYVEFLKKAVATNPLSAALHITLGDAYWQANKTDLAIEQYRLVLELEPDHADRVRLLNRIRGQNAVTTTRATT